MPKAVRWLNFVLGVGLTAAFVIWAVVSGMQRSWGTTPALLAVAAWSATNIGYVAMSRSAAARGTFGPSGTTLRPDWRMDVLSFAGLIVGCLAAVLCLILGVKGVPVYPIAIEYSPQFTLGSAVAAAGLAIALLWLIRRGGISRVTLSSEGFSFTGSGGRWDDVTAITDHSAGSTSPWTPLVMVMADGTQCILAEPAVYTPDGHGLRALVEFYWRHPESRFELVNGQALDRLHAQFL